MKKLDKSRPFNEVFGAAENGEKYKQDGVYFDLSGNEVGAKPEEPLQIEAPAPLSEPPSPEELPSMEETPSLEKLPSMEEPPSLELLAGGKRTGKKGRGAAKGTVKSAEDPSEITV